MEIFVKQISTPNRALNAARLTVYKQATDKEPSANWWAKMLLSEHSPIRLVEYDVIFKNIPRFVADQLARYRQGCEIFFQSQRPDRCPNDNRSRHEKPQDEPTTLQMSLNAQSLIYIARQRLCTKASKETRDILVLLKSKIQEIDPVLADKMQPNCVYHGRCQELNKCGYVDTSDYKFSLNNYLKIDY